MPAFMSKEADTQKEVFKSLSDIACLSLGSYHIILNSAKTSIGKVLFSSKTSKTVELYLCCKHCHTINESQLNKSFKVCIMEENIVIPNTSATSGAVKQLFGKFLNMQLCKDIGEDYWKFVRVLCNHFYIFDHGVSTVIINEKYLKEVLQTFKPFIDQVYSHHYWLHKTQIL